MMIKTEKMFPFVEEQEQDEMEEEDEKDDEEEGTTSSDNNNDDEEEKDEAEAGGEKKAEPSSAAEGKKPSDVLNLNNEVVKMRKEVKRVKALIIRKLTRQIVALKKKKGKEAEMERNQRRAARLLEEVHSMKKLPPDVVTKTALQKDLNFERVCKNPKSTMSDRAVARIASHPQFRKKTESIRAAVKDFREDRNKARKQGEHPKGQRAPEKATQLSPDSRQDRKNEDEDKDTSLNQQVEDIKEGAGVLKSAKKSVPQSPATSDASAVHKQEKPESTSAKATVVKSSMKPKPQSKHEEKNPRLQSVPESALESADEEESDLESSDDEEKEYFDDSTEERFRKQSASEESDEDDFFIGKVSKFKKKKKRETSGEVEVDKEQQGKKDPGDVKSDKLQSELDELESRLKSKPLTVQSVFCSSLAGGKGGGKAGQGGHIGKGTGKSGALGNSKTGGGLNDGCSGKFKFTKQEDRTSDSGAKFGKRPELDRKESGPAGRGRGKAVRKQKDNRGGGFLSHQLPQPALHPSWEASKKRKEQQGQILAFQGKKIKFDDDDD